MENIFHFNGYHSKKLEEAENSDEQERSSVLLCPKTWWGTFHVSIGPLAEFIPTTTLGVNV
ncbi:MAG TPA: hypothetical protein G4O11_11235 [Anaerolineae bacterium]|nr:hypothetical protein [Anaerolineae bacterium]